MHLQNKVALITGASRGIGREIAIEMAKEGATVIINYKSNDQLAEETVNKIKEISGIGYKVKGNVGNFKDTQNISDFILNKFGKIDVLVNNAGISNINPFIFEDENSINELLDVNLKGTIYMTKHIINSMISRNSGNILNISSIWGQTGASCEVLYSASKGGVDSFTKALSKEVSNYNIRVNAISPGIICTEMNSHLTNEELNEFIDEIPLKVTGYPKDISKLAVFLCSDNSKFITGQIIRVDGGYV